MVCPTVIAVAECNPRMKAGADGLVARRGQSTALLMDDPGAMGQCDVDAAVGGSSIDDDAFGGCRPLGQDAGKGCGKVGGRVADGHDDGDEERYRRP